MYEGDWITVDNSESTTSQAQTRIAGSTDSWDSPVPTADNSAISALAATAGHVTHFKHGKGLYKRRNGDEYDGIFVNDLREGLGEFKCMSEGYVYAGMRKRHNVCCLYFDWGLDHSV